MRFCFKIPPSPKGFAGTRAAAPSFPARRDLPPDQILFVGRKPQAVGCLGFEARHQQRYFGLKYIFKMAYKYFCDPAAVLAGQEIRNFLAQFEFDGKSFKLKKGNSARTCQFIRPRRDSLSRHGVTAGMIGLGLRLRPDMKARTNNSEFRHI